MSSAIRQTILAFSVSILLSGCLGTKLMRRADSLPAANPDQAKIVFMRDSFSRRGLTLDIHEIRDGKPHYIGNLPNAKKIAYLTNPGEKIFMTSAHSSDFMLANVEAGKTYYVIARPNWGTRGFAPTPIRQKSTDYNMQLNDFQDWTETTPIVPRPDRIKKWLRDNRYRFIRMYQEYWPRFELKSAPEKRARTLNPEDGVVVP